MPILSNILHASVCPRVFLKSFCSSFIYYLILLIEDSLSSFVDTIFRSTSGPGIIICAVNNQDDGVTDVSQVSMSILFQGSKVYLISLRHSEIRTIPSPFLSAKDMILFIYLTQIPAKGAASMSYYYDNFPSLLMSISSSGASALASIMFSCSSMSF